MINPNCPFSHNEKKEVSSACMWCQKESDITETIYTGDEDSYMGWEFWSYCKDCETDTFHIIEKK